MLILFPMLFTSQSQCALFSGEAAARRGNNIPGYTVGPMVGIDPWVFWALSQHSSHSAMLLIMQGAAFINLLQLLMEICLCLEEAKDFLTLKHMGQVGIMGVTPMT